MLRNFNCHEMDSGCYAIDNSWHCNLNLAFTQHKLYDILNFGIAYNFVKMYTVKQASGKNSIGLTNVLWDSKNNLLNTNAKFFLKYNRMDNL